MADNKFIFTTEGRRSLVSQLGGIKFAVLGAILVRGLTMYDIGSDDDDDTSEFEEAYKNLTLDDLALENGIVLGMKNVSYKSQPRGNVIPESNEEYLAAFSDIVHNTLPMQYIPSIEMNDKQGNIYGTYEFDFDKTLLSWDMANDISFQHIILLGKQYAETSDATFNVHETQKPVVVGIAQLTNNIDDYEHGGLELLKDQNQYVATKLKLRFTLDDHDKDIATDLDIDPEIKEISEKISLVNNGLKTMTDKGITMSIVNDKKVIEDLNLSDEGGIATTKTLMVAHECSVDQLENELNPGSLVHIVNREYDEDRYRKQLVFTTIEQNPTPDVGVFTAYHVQFLLKGTGETIPETTYVNPYLVPASSASSGTAGVVYQGTESPVFRQATVPEQDRVAVDMFGLENNILGEDNFDILLFSKGNVTLDPYGINDDGAGENLLIKSNYNYFNFTGANTDNVLINADYNMIVNGALSNLLFGADANSLDNVQGNAIFASNFNKIKGDSYYNVILGGNYHSINNSNNILMLGHEGLIANNVSEQVIFGKYNKNTNAKFVYGIGTSEYDRKNALEFYPELGELKVFKNGVVKATLGGDAGLTISSLELDTLKANAITANNKLVVHDTGTGGGINLYYNSTQSEAGLQIQGPGISGPYMLYSTSNGILSVGNNNPQGGKHRTYIQDEYVVCESETQTSENLILLNKNVNNELDNYNEAGTLTVYNNYRDAQYGSIIKKVNIDGTAIKFAEYDNNQSKWVTVKEITNKPEYTYKKARADIYVWGTGLLSDNGIWYLGVKYAAGTDNFKTWIKNIFEKTPPFVYTYTGSSNPKAGNLEYVKKVPVDVTHPQGYQLVFLGSSDSDMSTMRNIVNGNGNVGIGGNDSVVKGTAAESPLLYYSKIPESFDFEEIEINLFVHAWQRFGFIWMPYVTNNNTVIPQIKLNVHRDTNNTSNLAIWTNSNYNTDGDIHFENFEIEHYYTCVHASNFPFNKDIDDDPVQRASVSNPIGWWLEND